MSQDRSQRLPPTDLSERLALAARQAQAGEFDKAEAVLRKALREAPDHPAALNLLAIVEHRLGNTAAAVESTERALTIAPGIANSHANLVVMYRQLGDTQKAIEHGRRAVALKPNFADAHYNLGLALFDGGETEKAIRHYDQAIALNPRFAEAINNRAVALHKLARFAEAEAEYRRALAIRPAYPEALNNLGSVLRDQNRMADAIASYKLAVAARPDYLDALNNLIRAHGEAGQYREAIAAARSALRLSPNNNETWSRLISVYIDAGMADEAIATLKTRIASGLTTAETYDVLGRAYSQTNDIESALSAYREAIARRPDFAVAYSRMGGALRALGRLDEAVSALDRAVELDPTLTDVYLDIASSKIFASADDRHLQILEAMDLERLEPQRRIALHFALGKAYDDLGRYDGAFTHFAEGNALQRQTISYDAAADIKLIDRTIAVMSAEMIQTRSGHGAASARPIFVIGMARSGTTLVEQILASHPDAEAAGEINDLNVAVDEARARAGEAAVFPEFLPTLPDSGFAELGEAYLKAIHRHAPGAHRIVDKAQQNFYFMGLIHLALPNARIVHISRDPLDTCLSCFSKFFTGWNQTYDLVELGRFYRAYQRLMNHWRAVLPAGAFLDISYEELIADSEQSTRRILDYCGLDWNDAVRRFHANKRPVKTASFAQVRRPIYATSVGRWRHYSKHLLPLIAELGAERD